MCLQRCTNNAPAGLAPEVAAIKVHGGLAVRPGIGGGTKPRDTALAREGLVDNGVLKVVGDELLGDGKIPSEGGPHDIVTLSLLLLCLPKFLRPPARELALLVPWLDTSRPHVGQLSAALAVVSLAGCGFEAGLVAVEGVRGLLQEIDKEVALFRHDGGLVLVSSFDPGAVSSPGVHSNCQAELPHFHLTPAHVEYNVQGVHGGNREQERCGSRGNLGAVNFTSASPKEYRYLPHL